jgi:hypothetical protein
MRRQALRSVRFLIALLIVLDPSARCAEAEPNSQTQPVRRPVISKEMTLEQLKSWINAAGAYDVRSPGDLIHDPSFLTVDVKKSRGADQDMFKFRISFNREDTTAVRDSAYLVIGSTDTPGVIPVVLVPAGPRMLCEFGLDLDTSKRSRLNLWIGDRRGGLRRTYTIWITGFLADAR